MPHTKRKPRVHSKLVRKKTQRRTKLNRKITTQKYKKYEKLSPFELKNTLISMAKKSSKPFLNAGRGNPNFFNDFVRICFTRIQAACVKLSKHLPKTTDLSIYPLYDPKQNYRKLVERNLSNLSKNQSRFIQYYMNSIGKHKNSNYLFYDMIRSSLGTFYPSPPRIQPHNEAIADEYMRDLVFSTKRIKDKERDQYEYFAVEGAAAGIMYTFDSLAHNKLLKKGDTIAIITPIFSPYLELPKLAHYGLKILELKGDPKLKYALSNDTMDKLKNPSVKALFMVNPGNPTEYSLPRENIEYIGSLVKKYRNDLIVVSDCVYAPFVKQFNSFMETCPKNTIEIFSLSKYFGVTGMRLGIVMIRRENNLQKLLGNLSTKDSESLRKDYSIMTNTPDKLTLMERIVADSRQIAEAHVGGLSGPQQVIMGMFLAYSMYDRVVQKNKYRNSVRDLLMKRMKNVYIELKYEPQIDDKSTNYYTLIDIPKVTELLYGRDSVERLQKHNYIEFLFHLAKKYGVVLLPGQGFGTTPWKVRVSLANLDTEDYCTISQSIKNCIHDFVK